MPAALSLKSRVLDDKDREILMMLQKDGRESLTNIASKVKLTIDSVHNRIKAMLEKKIFFTGIFINPRAIGFGLVVDVKIKLGNVSAETRNEFVAYLTEHPRIVSLFSITGEHDFVCVLVAKDANEFENIATELRNKYKDVINDWKTTLFLKTYKLEHYDLLNMR